MLRAKEGISDSQFVYYLAVSPFFRNIAIKSMVGSSGRQRVQQNVLNDMPLVVPPLEIQREIGAYLAGIDEKISLNERINDNLPPHHICTLATKEDSGGNEEMPQAFSSLLAA